LAHFLDGCTINLPAAHLFAAVLGINVQASRPSTHDAGGGRLSIEEASGHRRDLLEQYPGRHVSISRSRHREHILLSGPDPEEGLRPDRGPRRREPAEIALGVHELDDNDPAWRHASVHE
jgi:hypothetical protein